MLRLMVLACVLLPLRAEIVDRIAITAGQQVITELQLDEELRVAAFLNRQPVVRDRAARRAAADRLIEQLLIKREMELSHYPLPPPEGVDTYVEQVRAALSSTEDFGEALRRYGLTEAILREHLEMQLTTLEFIEFRFRPDLGVSPAEIEAYYQQDLSRRQAEHPGAKPPTLAEARESIRQTLAERRTDEALDAWLKGSRNQVAIVYLDKSLE